MKNIVNEFKNVQVLFLYRGQEELKFEALDI